MALQGPWMRQVTVRHARSNKWVNGTPSVDFFFPMAKVYIVGLHLIAAASV